MIHLELLRSIWIQIGTTDFFLALFISHVCMYVCTAYNSMEDANFDRSVANQAVTYLHNEEEWARLILADELEGNLREGDYNFMDRVFDNEM